MVTLPLPRFVRCAANFWRMSTPVWDTSGLHRVHQIAVPGFLLASTSQAGQVLHQMATFLDLESLSTRR